MPAGRKSTNIFATDRSRSQLRAAAGEERLIRCLCDQVLGIAGEWVGEDQTQEQKYSRHRATFHALVACDRASLCNGLIKASVIGAQSSSCALPELLAARLKYNRLSRRLSQQDHRTGAIASSSRPACCERGGRGRLRCSEEPQGAVRPGGNRCHNHDQAHERRNRASTALDR